MVLTTVAPLRVNHHCDLSLSHFHLARRLQLASQRTGVTFATHQLASPVFRSKPTLWRQYRLQGASSSSACFRLGCSSGAIGEVTPLAIRGNEVPPFARRHGLRQIIQDARHFRHAALHVSGKTQHQVETIKAKGESESCRLPKYLRSLQLPVPVENIADARAPDSLERQS